MSVRLTLLKFAIEVYDKSKKPFCLADIKEVLDVKGNQSRKISPMLWELQRQKFLKIDKKLSKNQRNFYTVTATGRNAVIKNAKKIFTDEEFYGWLSETATPRSRGAERIYPAPAREAMESLAGLVETNERLMAAIRATHKQLGILLEEADERA